MEITLLKPFAPDAPDPGDDFNCRCWAEPAEPVILKGVSNDELLRFFEESEGNIEHMYLDTKGNVTIGIGMMLSNEEAAIELPFIIQSPSGQQTATAFEIRQAYRKIKLAPFGKNIREGAFRPSSKNQYDKIYITKEVGGQNLKRRLREDIKNLRRKFDNFDSFPVGVRQALLDIEFNIGGRKFAREKWPALFDAIQRKDWKKAARESNRRDIQPDRNRKVYDLFIRAGDR